MRILTPLEIDDAVDFLRRDEIVAFPTETVYGLGAPLFSKKAIMRIFAAKNRPIDNPLIAHVASIEDVLSIAEKISADFNSLIEVFWPGPLSIVLPAKKTVPEEARASLPTIVVRMPRHPIALSLISKLGQPIVAPSANRSGKPSATRLEHIIHDFTGKIEAVIDGGPCEEGLESTVLSLVNRETPTILRPGGITQQAIENVLKRPVTIATKGPILSPGMKYRHYAPEAPIRLIFDPSLLSTYANRPNIKLLHRGDGSLRGDTFYAVLRESDLDGSKEIVILCDEVVCKDAALFDRIQKAAHA